VDQVRAIVTQAEFIDAVVKKNLTVVVTTGFSVKPMAREGATVMVPVALIRYVAKEKTSGGGVEWVLEETVIASDGDFDYSKTALEALRAVLQPPY